MPFREIGWEISQWWIVYIPGILAVIAIGYGGYERYRLWRLGKPASIFENLGGRIKSFINPAIFDGFAHRRLFGVTFDFSGVRSLSNELREGVSFFPPKIATKHPLGGLIRSAVSPFIPKEFYPGIIHFLLFGGAGLLLLGTAMDVIAHYDYPFMRGATYLGFSLVNDLGGVFMLLGVILALIRRYIQRPQRLTNTAEDALILGLIFVVVLSGFILEGFRICAVASHTELAQPGWARWSFLGYALSLAFDNLAPATQLVWYQWLWWGHMVFTMGVIIYISLAFSKLTHIIVAPLNVFFRSLRPKGALVPILNLEEAESFGAEKIEDFTWKQLMDLDACTGCGRCQDNCPVYLSGKALSPKKLIQDLKSHLEEKGRKSQNNSRSLIGEVISEDDIWACTTCRACQQVCPVFVEHIDKTIEMRRYLVLSESRFPETAMGALTSIETRGHPWRGTTAVRTDWADGLGIKELSQDSEIDILYWVGCTEALEDRSMKVAIAVGKILKKAGIKFGILGSEETCCGEPARRMGNEYLFQIQAQRNIELLKSYQVKKIITACPHCFNTIKNEYPQFGGEFEVIHHTEFIANLIKNGRIEPFMRLDQKVTYQDSCYLGRYNGIYDAPREILASIPRLNLTEMAWRKEKGFCCGGGGGRMWMEEQGTRVNHMRTEDVIKTGAQIVATACPFCLQMFEDGIKAKGVEESLKAMDIAELINLAIPSE